MADDSTALEQHRKKAYHSAFAKLLMLYKFATFALFLQFSHIFLCVSCVAVVVFLFFRALLSVIRLQLFSFQVFPSFQGGPGMWIFIRVDIFFCPLLSIVRSFRAFNAQI